MNKDRSAAYELAREISAGLPSGFDADVALFPAAPFLTDVVEAVREAPHPIVVGAQNAHFESSGAFTGELAMSMILSTGATSVILGHSERRHVFGEDNDLVGRKVAAALAAGVGPILCVGETLEEREADRTEAVVLGQLRAGLGVEGTSGKLSPDDVARVIVAYEPVWAIGTGKTATPEQGGEIHQRIRSELESISGASVAGQVRILYGGSVKPSNVKALLSQPDIDGALVGGASLDAESFLKLCKWREQ